MATLFTLPLVVVMMLLPHTAANDGLHVNVLPADGALPGSLTVMALLGVALSTPVQFGVGARFYRSAYAALKHGGSNMDVLIALGTTVAYGYSLGTVVAMMLSSGSGMSHHGDDDGDDGSMASMDDDDDDSGSSSSSNKHAERAAQEQQEGAHFFETAAMLITFVALGNWLQAYTRGETSSAVRALLELEPSEATILELTRGGAKRLRARRRTTLITTRMVTAAVARMPARATPQRAMPSTASGTQSSTSRRRSKPSLATTARPEAAAAAAAAAAVSVAGVVTW